MDYTVIKDSTGEYVETISPLALTTNSNNAIHLSEDKATEDAAALTVSEGTNFSITVHPHPHH